MICPKCESEKTRVLSVIEEDRSINRTRLCASCRYQFTTLERVVVGESHKPAIDTLKITRNKLTVEDINYIRTNPEKLSQKELAKTLNVTQSTISKIQGFITWRHI